MENYGCNKYITAVTHNYTGILHSAWNFGRFPLPLQPIKSTGSWNGSIYLIFRLLQSHRPYINQLINFITWQVS
jgi:hypothetical protein